VTSGLTGHSLGGPITGAGTLRLIATGVSAEVSFADDVSVDRLEAASKQFALCLLFSFLLFSLAFFFFFFFFFFNPRAFTCDVLLC
jgi:hypothetical protein